jgi:hypothetical protein
MTVGAINPTGPDGSVLNSARAFLVGWMRSSTRQTREDDRPPQGMDLVNAAADELARDRHIQSVQCRHVETNGRPGMELVVVPSHPELASQAARSCGQMAALVTPVTEQEHLPVRFHVQPTH